MTDEPLAAGNEPPFLALRRLARQAAAAAEEHCDLCGEAIGPEHRHLLDLAKREVLCACRACTFLLDQPMAGGGTRRLIPTRCLCLTDFEMADAQWESLQVPVNMAFFCYSTAAKRMTAFYPSPMGPTESLLPLAAWDEIAQCNPILQQMEPDVEALLVHQVRDGGEYYLVPIDECYRLVGLIRLHWKGLGGGSEVRQEILRFFARLKAWATPTGSAHA